MAQITLPTGKRRTKSGKNQKEVLDWLTEQRSKIKKGTYVTDESLKLGDFLTSYMENTAIHTLRPGTYQTNEIYVRKHINPELGNIKLVSLQPDHLQKFYTLKLEEGLSKRTVQYFHSILHKALKQAQRWGKIAVNPADLVDPPRPERKIPVIWSPEDVRVFLDAVKDHRYYPIYVTAIYTGMRQAELMGIHKSDVSLEKAVIYVKHQVQLIKGKGLTVTDVKTEKSRRPVTLPPFALNVLKEQLKSVESGLIFTTSTGKPISARNLYRHFKETIAKLGLPDIRFHDLRHSHASWLFHAGTHPKVVQERLGHSSVSFTLDIYAHSIPNLQDEAALKIKDILS